MEKSKVLLLDGGLATELEKHISYDINKEPLWTAKALFCEEQAIFDTHLKYLEGADIIETASYQATVPGFLKYSSLSQDISEKLLKQSATIAKNAVDRFLQSDEAAGRAKPLVVGSIGPYGAFLNDGSEYRGTYIETVIPAEIVELHLPRIKALVNGGVDLLAIETMPALKEVEILLELLKRDFPTTQAWVSFSVMEADSTRTSYGDSLIEAFKTVSKYSQVWGIGINCCSPTAISPFLKDIACVRQENPGVGENIKLVVYPNAGQEWIPGTGWSKEADPSLNAYLDDWLGLGVNVVGGCCQVGSREISLMRPIIDNWNSKNSGKDL